MDKKSYRDYGNSFKDDPKMVYRNKTFANGVVVGLGSGKVELGADGGDLLIKSGGSTTTVRQGLGYKSTTVTIVANKALHYSQIY